MTPIQCFLTLYGSNRPWNEPLERFWVVRSTAAVVPLPWEGPWAVLNGSAQARVTGVGCVNGRRERGDEILGESILPWSSDGGRRSIGPGSKRDFAGGCWPIKRRG
jgi:hypothetical protein